MKKKDKRSETNTRYVYIRDLNHWEEVDEEFYQEFKRYNDAFRQKMRYQGICGCPPEKWWVCDINCSFCKYKKKKATTSLDAPIDGENGNLTLKDIIPDTSMDVEEYVCGKIDSERLVERLGDLMPDAVTIGNLRTQDISDEKIAKVIGVPRTTFLSRLKSVKGKLIDEGYDDF